MALDELVQEYTDKCTQSKFDLIAFYKSMPRKEVIDNAAQCINPNGYMDSHQYRVGYENCSKGAELLHDRSDDI